VDVVAGVFGGARDGVRWGRGCCGARGWRADLGAGLFCGSGAVVGLEWRADGKRIL
jgi:hypothetical protein